MGMIVRLLVVALPAWGKERERRAALARLIRDIRERGPATYNPFTNRLSRRFAESVLELQRHVEGLAPIYRKVEESSSGRRAVELRLLRNYVRSTGLDPSAFSFEGIATELSDKGGWEVEEADSLFSSRLAVFDTPAFRQFRTAYTRNLQLAALISFDFESLVLPFRRDVQAKDIGLRSAPAEFLLDNLQDLHFLVGALAPEASAETALESIAKVLQAPKEATEEACIHLRGATALIKDELSGDRLAALIRCAAGEPELELRTFAIEGDGLGKVVEAIAAEYWKKRNEYADESSRKRLDDRMKRIFGDIPLMPLEGYSEELSAALAEAGLGSFRYVLPLRILKTFIALHLSKVIRPALSRLGLEADIPDRSLASWLGDGIEALVALAESIDRLDQDLALGSRSGLVKLAEKLPQTGADLPERSKARRTVDEANTMADRIVQDAFGRFASIREMLQTLRDDLRSRAPAIILNAPFLLSKKPELVKGLEQALELVEQVSELLGAVAVDLGAARRSLAPKEKALPSD